MVVEGQVEVMMVMKKEVEEQVMMVMIVVLARLIYSLSSRPLTGELDGGTAVWGKAWGRSAAPHTPTTSRKLVTLFCPPPMILFFPAAPYVPLFLLSLSLTVFSQALKRLFESRVPCLATHPHLLPLLRPFFLISYRIRFLLFIRPWNQRKESLYSQGIWVRLSLRLSSRLSVRLTICPSSSSTR